MMRMIAMMNFNQLKKEIADGKEDILSKYSKTALMRKIKALCDAYYISYLNNDADNFHAAAKMLDDMVMITEDKYPNVNDYINYCLIESLNKILNERMPRKYLLFNPEDMSIDAIYKRGLYAAIKRRDAERDILIRNPVYDEDVI